MNYVGETVRAVLMMGLPVAALSFLMVWWALYRGMLEAREDMDALKKELEAFGKKQGKKEEKQRVNPVHEKWFKFGGGFYGLVALYTYALVEWDEIIGFLGNIPEMVFSLNIGILINFFIDSFMNFITAISWPVYWMSRSDPSVFWIWFLVAYGGYWAGMKGAHYVAREKGLDDPRAMIEQITGSDEDEP